MPVMAVTFQPIVESEIHGEQGFDFAQPTAISR